MSKTLIQFTRTRGSRLTPKSSKIMRNILAVSFHACIKALLNLPSTINQQTQPLEEQLRSQLVAMTQDCQDKVFSAYKAFKRARSSESSTEVMQGREDSIAKIQTKVRETTPDIVSAAFESAPLQNNDQADPFLTYSTDANPQHNYQAPQERSFSDSAYGTQVCDCFDF